MVQPAASPGRRILVQIAGIVVGLGLLAWCIWLAARPENRDQLARLREAPPGQIAALLGLSVLSLVANGIVFWSLIQPAKRLGFWYVLMVNAIATCLAYLPFKLSLVFRFFIHRTRDQIPVLTISAWLAAAAAALVASLGSIVAVAAIGGGGGPYFIPLSAGAVVVTGILAMWLARVFAGPAGLARLRGFTRRTHLPFSARLAESASLQHMHAGFDMIASPRAWPLAILGRLADLAVQAIRFKLAAGILGVELSTSDSILLAVVYYTLGAAAPSGALGAREGGAVGLAKLMHMGTTDQFAGIVLLVTAADAIPTLAAALGSILTLGVRGVARSAGGEPANPPKAPPVA
ncbi:MAG: flippase-like domain-containing protein [Phycisphaerales bacterium]|nr:flippase-like domain-containing protein [Phycisphaerales bacterium]